MRLKKIRADCGILKNDYEKLLREYRNFKKETQDLKKVVSDKSGLYELMQDMSRYLSIDEAFFVFRDKIKKDFALQDCLLLKRDAEINLSPDYQVFTLKVNHEPLGSIAIKGLKKEDENHFYIMFNQLLLVLKRLHLFHKIQASSITDNLTGLYLRRFFEERLKEEIVRSRKFNLNFVILLLDLDYFKSYNDRYGHLTGDTILTEVGTIIRDNLRSIDIAARYGGEEFVIILPDTDKKGGSFVAGRLCCAIAAQEIVAYDEKLHITVSIGGCLFPENGIESQILIDQADSALYRAKETGRNKVCFYGEEK